MLQGNIANLLCSIPSNSSIAFDFDGTLVNCKIRQVEVLRSILRRQEINLSNLDFEKWWNLKINGLSTYEALIKMQIHPDIAKVISINWINNIENAEWLDFDILKKNVLELFQKLKEMNIPIYVITARKSEYLFTNQIKKLLLDQYISKIFVVNPSNSIEEKKEILKILKPFFFIGDTENDLYSATKSGVGFIAISTGQRSKQFLIDIGANSIIENF